MEKLVRSRGVKSFRRIVCFSIRRKMDGIIEIRFFLDLKSNILENINNLVECEIFC